MLGLETRSAWIHFRNRARSIQLGHHFLLRHRGEIVDVEPLRCQDGLDVGGHQLGVQVWRDGKLCKQANRQQELALGRGLGTALRTVARKVE